MTSKTEISVHTKHLELSDPFLPALVLRVTRLVDSYMLWVGTTESSSDNVDRAILEGNLCKDWACAMPPKTAGMAAPATSLFRSLGSDVALSMAQRLAKRFHKQVFVSVDVPPSFLSSGQGPRLLLEAERGIVGVLVGIEELVN